MKIILRVIFIGIILTALTGCSTSMVEKKKITNNAINYFANKYNIDKKNIKIIDNYLYGKNEFCIDSCGENELIINFKDKNYIISYNESANFFGDNYQYDKVYEDLLNYLNNEFKFANKIEVSDLLEADVKGTSEKYDGNIKEYYNKIKDFYSNSIYTWVDIWIEAKTPEEAKNLENRYSKIIVKELDSLGVNYNIAISTESDNNEYSAFYYYHVYDDYFSLTDNVDNKRNNCNRSQLQDGKCY